MKVLLIEDDAEMIQTLSSILREFYTVETASSGKDGCYKAKVNSYELVILDLGLEDMDGIAVCKAIREKGKTMPILVLTGKYQLHFKVAALDAGADDYLTKPFNRAELLARIRALLRRPPSLFLNQELLRCGDLLIDQGKRTVTYKNETVQLRRKEFHLLEYLMRNSGQVITRAMILDHVWESDVDQLSNTVDVHIKYLRDKLDRRFAVHLIQTVPGVGYRLEV